MSKSLIPVVDEQDRIIGYKSPREIESGDIYRVAALWITNSKGDILLAQRGFQELHDPGMWGPAVAGTVEKGETYDSNITKEAEEEIGLKGIKFARGPKRRITGTYDYFTQWYGAIVDRPADRFVFQKEELEQLRWFSREELTRELRDHPEKYLDLRWPLENL